MSAPTPEPTPAAVPDPTPAPGGKTLIVFSGDLDRAIAAFTIATGAAAMGDQVTMFFTFWGLTILRHPDRPKVRKSPVDALFGALLPAGPGRLGLSRMNAGGLGPWLLRRVMRQRHLLTLEELMATAREQDVTLVACTMSMDALGLSPDELIEGVEYAGVATYLAAASESSLNLFV